MFTLSEVHIAHGVVVVKDTGCVDLPIEQVGLLLDWKLEKVFQEDVLIFDKPPIKLFPSGGDLHVRVSSSEEGALFSWHAEPHILHIWPTPSETVS